MSETTDIIFPSDERAASYREVAGWVSRNGLFFGANENWARFDGATHRPCSRCGVPVSKNALPTCADCRCKLEDEQWQNRVEIEWPGGMVYCDNDEQYYDEPGDAINMADDENIPLRSLRLRECTPKYAQLDLDNFEHVLPSEDTDYAHPKLLEAIEAFNATMAGIPLSWVPGPRKIKIEVQP